MFTLSLYSSTYFFENLFNFTFLARGFNFTHFHPLRYPVVCPQRLQPTTRLGVDHVQVGLPRGVQSTRNNQWEVELTMPHMEDGWDMGVSHIKYTPKV